MAVGISILSGARQGQRLEFDVTEFRAGGERGCEVFFDPQLDAAAQGREALFRLDDDGWSLKNVGRGELLVNDRVVQVKARLRSGDVVRLSPEGPGFSFNLLARLSAPATPGVQTDPKTSPAHGWDLPSEASTLRKLTTSRWALALTVCAIGGLGLLIASRSWKVAVVPDASKGIGRRKDSAAEKAHEPQEPRGDGNKDERTHAPKTAAPDPTETDDDEDSALTSPEMPARDPWDIAHDELRDATFLLAVEEPKSQTQWPFATAAAIGDQTLLTSATVVVELAQLRRSEWKLWAMNQKNGAKIEIVDQRVHAGFERAAGQPDLQIYADLGVVTIATKYLHTAALATAQDLDDLDRGQPLACLGIAHDAEPLNRFQSYAPEMVRGKLFVITSLPPSPGGPRLLHVRMTMAAKVYGAPVFNEAGRVVGVFAESAAPAAEQAEGELNLHYVPVVDPLLIRAWLEQRDETLWVPPTLPPVKAVGETEPKTP